MFASLFLFVDHSDTTGDWKSIGARNVLTPMSTYSTGRWLSGRVLGAISAKAVGDTRALYPGIIEITVADHVHANLCFEQTHSCENDLHNQQSTINNQQPRKP